MSVGFLSFLLCFFLSGVSGVPLSPCLHCCLYLFEISTSLSYEILLSVPCLLSLCLSLYVFMSLLPSPVLSLPWLHPSIHLPFVTLRTTASCSSAKNRDILSHQQVRDTPHLVAPAPVRGSAGLSLSVFFLPPHFPSAPPHPRCLHFSKLHP